MPAPSPTSNPTRTLINRISYCQRVEHLEGAEQGFKAWLGGQLAPPVVDGEMQQVLQQATLHIKYKERHAESDDANNLPLVDEHRKLGFLNASPAVLMEMNDPLPGKIIPYEERKRPAKEVMASTVLHQLHSRYQLKELMVEFWHNHFNVSEGVNYKVSASLPLYDTVMRTHCLGNFRQLLEAVAKSPAMLYYLNNNDSKASPANENFARELFELHTLGAQHYFNNLYDRWRKVPGAMEGRPIGYIDEDVYEAARAFTGWTVGDGTRLGFGEFPRTGDFYYFDGWHDNYQKRVLGNDIYSNQPPLSDGMQVLDMVAFHPGTAVHICTKLCKRLVGDAPSQSLINHAAQVWQTNKDKPNQIALVVKAIAESREFAASAGSKFKRPPEVLASLLGNSAASLKLGEPAINMYRNMGWMPFNWASPTGHPDDGGYWMASNLMLNRWNALLQALDNNNGITMNLAAETPAVLKTVQEKAGYWCLRLTGKAPEKTLQKHLLAVLDGEAALKKMVSLIALSPQFQYR